MVSLCPLWLMSQATYCFRLGIKRSVSQLELYSPFGSGLPVCEYRKQLTPQTVYIHRYIIYQGKSVSCLSQHTVNCPDSTDGTALNASSICLPSLRNDATKIRIIQQTTLNVGCILTIFISASVSARYRPWT